MLPKLRPYQQLCKTAFQQAFRNGERRVGALLPTGTGKTVIFADMAAEVHRLGNRVVVLVHRDTLVGQAYKKLVAAGIPEHSIGIVKANKNEVAAPVIVASIHTLRNPERMRQIVPPNLTIVDEAHVSVSPTYHAYYQHVDAVPGGRGYLAGFTATWMRNDSAGLGDIWERVVFKRSVKWAVRNGYLVPPHAIQLGGQLDLSEVRTVTNPNSENYGDYNERDLEELIMVDDLLEPVVKGYHKFAEGMPAVLFAPTQASAKYFLDGLAESGVPVAEIFAGTSPAARRWHFAAFDAGTTHVLGTCTALAEGWDCPRCAVALMVRPTRSPLMFIQQVGRILRPWPGKTEGLILDFVGCTDDQTLAAHVDLGVTPEKREAGELEDEDVDEPDDFERVPIERMAKKINGVHDVDLFAGTDARWLRTSRQIPFVQTRDHTYFIALHQGEYAVGRMGAWRQSCNCHGGGKWVATGLSSDEALEHGSDLALEEDPSVANKKSAWRTRSAEPSPQQRDQARRLGVDPEGMTKAALSDAISVAIANGLLARVGGQ
jgi:superfamily II DNA or RNA helicase